MSGRAGGVDILRTARTNDAFRREIMTGTHAQVVVMTIPPGREIGEAYELFSNRRDGVLKVAIRP